MTEEKKEEAISPEKASAVLIEERKKREAACSEELKALMQKHNCVVEIAMLVTTQGNRPQIAITAK